MMAPHPHVWTECSFFVTDTAIAHTYSMKTMTENGTFRKRSPEWVFLKMTRLHRVDAWKRNFSMTMTSHYQSQFSSRNFYSQIPKLRTHASRCCLSCLGLFQDLLRAFDWINHSCVDYQRETSLGGLHYLFKIKAVKTTRFSHAQNGFLGLAFSKWYSVFVWTGRNDSKTLRLDAYFFLKNEKKFSFHVRTGSEFSRCARQLGMCRF